MTAASGSPVAPAPAHPHAVHLLVVHGVGRHDHLSNLLRTYQSFRANLTSVEAPVTFEDQIPGWRLAQFDEASSPPALRLEPRDEGGAVRAVSLYEVNYAGLAGVLRRNHPIDLMNLFLGLDLAVCAARQRQRASTVEIFTGDTTDLGRCFQRISSVFVAGTVPIIGIPSIIFRNYISTIVATFTRFFEDVATFVLDKNGEQIISSHLDRTIDNIAARMQPGDRLVVAAHSLGSVVAHNYVVRNWTSAGGPLPETLITFGSPIGLLTWIWLFLDFHDMDFNRPVRGGGYFCWQPVANRSARRRPVSWINVLNCADPIATSFPTAALDLSANTWDIIRGLKRHPVPHLHFGRAGVTEVGVSHTRYFDDKTGFLEVVLRAAGINPEDPAAVEGARSPEKHLEATRRVLLKLQWGLYVLALLGIALYCWLIARRFAEPRVLWVIAAFAWPLLTIGMLAFFQRLLFGGPTKRIERALIREMRWLDTASLPYRLREMVRSWLRLSKDVDPMAKSPGYGLRLILSAISFLPTLLVMLMPVAVAAWLTGTRPSLSQLFATAFSVSGLLALAAFSFYVVSCALHELVRAWRSVIRLTA